METTIDTERLAEIMRRLVHRNLLRELIDTEREQGRAFGVVAEAARDELAKRTGDARV